MIRLFLISVLLLSALSAAQEIHNHPAPEKLGTVSFQTACKPQTQQQFNRAVALLHSFAYTVAEKAFQSVAEQDPQCRGGEQSMLVMGEGRNPGVSQLAALAKRHGLKNSPAILAKVQEAIANWPRYARERWRSRPNPPRWSQTQSSSSARVFDVHYEPVPVARHNSDHV